jgi:3-oxoacyl-[acyl-carrier-protein] synthase-3
LLNKEKAQVKSRFESFGLYVPDREVTTTELMDSLKERTNLTIEFEEITGIRARRWRSEGETSYSIAMNGARDCLRNSRYQAGDIDIVISTSISRTMQPATYYLNPALSVFIKKELGAHRAWNFDINNACAGMMTGAYLLDGMIRAGIIKTGMVVSGESITPITETALREIKDPLDAQFSSLTVGDAGSAFIMDAAVSDDECIDFIELMTMADYSPLCIGRPSLISGNPCMITKTNEMHDALKYAWPFLNDKLKMHNASFDEYDYIITHQVTAKMVKWYLKQLGIVSGLKDLPTLISAGDYGNTASTTLFLVLYNGLKQKKIRKGSKILLVALASGIVIGHLSFAMGDLEV